MAALEAVGLDAVGRLGCGRSGGLRRPCPGRPRSGPGRRPSGTSRRRRAPCRHGTRARRLPRRRPGRRWHRRGAAHRDSRPPRAPRRPRRPAASAGGRRAGRDPPPPRRDRRARRPAGAAPGRPPGGAGSTCVSGSPKRALHSRRTGPSAVSIRPAYSAPRNGVPRRASSARIGRWKASRIASTASSGRSVERAERAHAAGVRAAVAVEQALVVARDRERERVAAVAQGDDAGLGPCEPFLDHDPRRPACARAPAAERGDRRSASTVCRRRSRPCRPPARPP